MYNLSVVMHTITWESCSIKGSLYIVSLMGDSEMVSRHSYLTKTYVYTNQTTSNTYNMLTTHKDQTSITSPSNISGHANVLTVLIFIGILLEDDANTIGGSLGTIWVETIS